MSSTDAHRQIQEQERPTYSGLGARIEQLLRLAEEQATELVQAARSEANEIKAAAKVDGAELRAAAENEAAELRANAKRETDDMRGAAEREADSIRTTARREADELTSTTEREVAKLRATADHEVAEKRAATERDIAKLRTTTEREVAQLKAAAKRERDEILTTSKRQADEMRSQAQRILEESEAQRAQAEAEFEIQLAARREEAERQEAERLSAAQAATQKLVSEAEQRASTAEQRAAKASAQADQTRRDADQHARQLVSATRRRTPTRSSPQAKAQADQLMSETKTEAERRRVAAQREVDELTRQKDNISTHLAQVRQLLGGQLGVQMPAMPDPAVPRPRPSRPSRERARRAAAAVARAVRQAGTARRRAAPRPAGAARRRRPRPETTRTGGPSRSTARLTGLAAARPGPVRVAASLFAGRVASAADMAVRPDGGRARSVVPGGRQGSAAVQRRRVDRPHDLVEHDADVVLPHPQVLGAVHADHLGLGHPGEALPRLVGPQVVVELGHERDQRPAGRRPAVQVLVGGPVQRRRQQDRRPGRRGSSAPAQRQLGAERPAEQPDLRQPRVDRVADGRLDVVALRLAAAELAVALALLRLGAPGVEAQHGQVRQRGQPVRRLADARGCPSCRRASAAGAGRPAWRPGRGPRAAPARRPGSARRRW